MKPKMINMEAIALMRIVYTGCGVCATTPQTLLENNRNLP